jgi:hypothetical protein
MAVLALDISGVPRDWISYDKAIEYYAKDLVAWELGETVAKYHGGYKPDGTRSYLETSSIIAVKGSASDFSKRGKVILTNSTLFARDRNICGYCGNHFVRADLSRDHIVPKFLGGQDEWTNVITSCISCNQKKGCKTLEKSGMQLKFLPYEPNRFEHLILQNRRILTDQMEYLLSGVPKHSRILQDFA